MTGLDLTGTTVTLFGNSDPFDQALSDELGRRGCNTHYVSVPTGWLRSATHAVVRLDTASGAQALQELANTEQPRAHVIAVCAQQTDVTESDRFSELCRSCGANHDISLIWHPPLGAMAAARIDLSPSNSVIAPDLLVVTIADEIAEQSAVDGTPAFATRPIAPDPRLRGPSIS